MTYSTPLMSKPRAATSVAMRSGLLPLLNASTESSRSRWDMSPWMHAACQFCRLKFSCSRAHSFLYRANTSVRGTGFLPPRYFFNTRARCESLSLGSTTSTTCVTECDALRPSAPIRTLTGLHMNSAARPWMDIGHVAENITVWRSARVCPAISRISGSNPRSSILSASSSTSIVTLSSRTSPSFIKSRSRPGVATITAHPPPCFMRFFCSHLGAPPYTHTHRTPHVLPASSKTLAVCCASSRVGASTSAWHSSFS
mmetsp:Transcript_2369/g.6189  ORF Transcript_2369/g.6189 Transcript_2369/m.6189 type:complete len:256 (+) Transcript_2369:383-1150(+)